MAGVSPTPLAQAAFDSISGTPKSAPDRPYAELLDKLNKGWESPDESNEMWELVCELNTGW